MPRILWRVSPSLGWLSVRWSVRSPAETRSTLATTLPYSEHWLLTLYGLFLSRPRFFHEALRHSASLWFTRSGRLH